MAKTWQGDVDNTLLIVRCGGKRIFAVIDGSPEVIVPHSTGRPIERQALRGTRIGNAMTPLNLGAPMPLACPIHSAGHDIDGAKLRQILDIRCRRGKVINEDIERVVTIKP